MGEFIVELAPGWRMADSDGVEASWSCPKYKELGCPATFITRIEPCQENLGETEDNDDTDKTYRCSSTVHCEGCKKNQPKSSSTDSEGVHPLLFGIFSKQFIAAFIQLSCFLVPKDSV